MRMPISEETRAALGLLKDVQEKVANTDDLKNNAAVTNDLNTLISVLESPVFQSILNIQDSLRELKRQVQLHPSILPADFDITANGELVLNLPPAAANGSNGSNGASTPRIARDDVDEDKASSIDYEEGVLRACEEAAQGRDVKYIDLFKPERSSLGFSVVGLRSVHKGELGIYVQEIQNGGIAAQDGRSVS